VLCLVGMLIALLTGFGTAAFGATPIALGPALPGGSRSGVEHMSVQEGPPVRPAGRARPDTGARFHCQEPGAEYECYGPRQIRTAYRFNALLKAGKDGSGETIVIIDGSQSPTLSSDLASFDSAFGLPAPNLEIVAPFGITPWDPSAEPIQIVASAEISLDVEWAHAIAPGAKLVLALAPTNSNADFVATERYVIEHNLGDVISMSFGETEGCEAPTLQEEEHDLFKTAVDQGMTVIASAGDFGSAEFNCEETGFLPAPTVATPASDPNVTAVGGTALIARLRSGKYESESVWNEESEGEAGGGGFSLLYPAPKYQQGVSGITSQRGVPDISYDGANHGGVVVAWGSSGEPNEFWVFGGTSAGAPQWAALTAIADQVAQRRLGNINPALYAIGKSNRAPQAFHDITVGNNDFPPVTGYAAAPGWDAASGWGSPQASKLVKDLVSSNAEHGDQSSPINKRASSSNPGAGKEHRFKPF
jgi:subtilase family serine protease